MGRRTGLQAQGRAGGTGRGSEQAGQYVMYQVCAPGQRIVAAAGCGSARVVVVVAAAVTVAVAIAVAVAEAAADADAEPSRVVAAMEMTMTRCYYGLPECVLRLEALAERVRRDCWACSLGLWNLGEQSGCRDGRKPSTVSSSQPKSQSRAASPKPGCRCLLMLALVLVVLMGGPGPAWAGPRVSPGWNYNKTAGATGICDDRRRVTSHKKKRKRGMRR